MWAGNVDGSGTREWQWFWEAAAGEGLGSAALSLGFVPTLCCSEEEEGSWLPARGADCVDAQPPESKIRSL